MELANHYFCFPGITRIHPIWVPENPVCLDFLHEKLGFLPRENRIPPTCFPEFPPMVGSISNFSGDKLNFPVPNNSSPYGFSPRERFLFSGSYTFCGLFGPNAYPIMTFSLSASTIGNKALVSETSSPDFEDIRKRYSYLMI